MPFHVTKICTVLMLKMLHSFVFMSPSITVFMYCCTFFYKVAVLSYVWESNRCIPPNPRRVGYIVPIHGHLDGPLYMGSHIHQQLVMIITSNYRLHSVNLTIKQSN
jgi:uncharacterized protein Usg